MSFLKKIFGEGREQTAHSIIGMEPQEDPNDPMGAYEDRLRAARFYGWAEGGDPRAQATVAVFFADGTGVAKDYIEAYKWAHLAAAQGLDKARLIRDFVAQKMTQQQIAEAQDRARTFVPVRQDT